MSKLETTFRTFLGLELQQYGMSLGVGKERGSSGPDASPVEYDEEFPASQVEGIGLSWAIEVAVCALGQRIARCGGVAAFESHCSIAMTETSLTFHWCGYVIDAPDRRLEASTDQIARQGRRHRDLANDRSP